MALHSIDGMAVEVEGEGDAVVLVHGLGGTSNTWTPLMGALSRHQAIRPDLPGSGRSGGIEGALSIARFVDSLVAACERLKVERAHWVGHSLGTIVCQHLAATAPDRVEALLLFGPLAAPPEPARAALLQRAARARSEGMYPIADALLQTALSSTTRRELPLAVAATRESLLAQDAEGYARTCEALAAAQPARLDDVRCPVLLVTGDEDGVAPPQAVRALGERFRAAGCEVSVEVLARCGHWTPLERAADCTRLAREFLVRQVGRSPARSS
jgi:3-oxoadipate enol-lactonase